MDIKFKKLFKTMVIFFVVFVMIFNSFAAISVSDGSAFVTKAEFSADLNNLSNRMSALENSIDAKIDSLVSSYLSRNGIWNGEKQEVTATKYWDKAAPTITLDSSGNASFSGSLFTSTFIANLTKTGLLTGFMYYTDGDRNNLNSVNSRWGYIMTYNSNLRYTTGSGFALYAQISEVIGSTVTPKFYSVLGSSFSQFLTQSDPNKGSFGLILPASEISYPVTFFVQKGSKIQISLNLDIHIQLANGSLQYYDRPLRIGVKDGFYVY